MSNWLYFLNFRLAYTVIGIYVSNFLAHLVTLTAPSTNSIVGFVMALMLMSILEARIRLTER